MGSWTTLSKSFFINCFKPDLKLVKVFLTRKIKSLIRKRMYACTLYKVYIRFLMCMFKIFRSLTLATLTTLASCMDRSRPIYASREVFY
jgi:hypothetical protein